MKYTCFLAAFLATTPSIAEETRQLDAHEHGIGQLNIAIDGTTVAMEFHAPGADIVGFEHAATSEQDRAKVDAAVATLAAPLALFDMPDAAGCTVTRASAELEGAEAHEEHAEHHEHDDHDEHAKHEEHHEHDDHDEHAEHEEHDDHDDHANEAGHTEFHAEYTLTCAQPDALDKIVFGYFDTFENARELEVQIITANGAKAFEVERDAPTLDLRNLF